jgi:hypothetical protein
MLSFPGLKERGIRYLQAAARANNLPPDCIKAVEKKGETVNHA